MTEDEAMRITPQSEIDLQMLLTDPKWGMQVPEELKQKLMKVLKEHYVQDEEGNIHKVKEQSDSLWGLLAYYTRDVRLGNLSKFDGEEFYVRYFIDLAGDCLRADYIRSFVKALSLAVTVLETSQSRGGFLRKRQGTITQEKKTGELEPPKKSLFGLRKKTPGGDET